MKQRSCKIFGILNVTPDSFSDGGKFNSVESAYKKLESLASEGADIIDIGAESTRPDAKTLSPDEEWQRLKPVLEIIKKENVKTPISIDSRNHETLAKALDCGISYVNDVSGLQDEKIISLIKKYDVKAIFMHSLTIPADKNINIPENEDAVPLLKIWAKNKIENLIKSGVKGKALIFDPGIGFSKTAKQSFEIIKRISEFNDLNIPILVGHSEKSFLSLFTDKPAGERNIETNVITSYLASKNVDYIRVHNVSEAKRAIKISSELLKN